MTSCTAHQITRMPVRVTLCVRCECDDKLNARQQSTYPLLHSVMHEIISFLVMVFPPKHSPKCTELFTVQNIYNNLENTERLQKFAVVSKTYLPYVCIFHIGLLCIILSVLCIYK